MADRWGRAARAGVGIVLGALGLTALPAACIFPEYTFNEPEPSGSGGGATGSASASTTGSSPGSGGTGGATNASSSSTGIISGGEDCVNGADDDEDGLTDCADEDCNPVATCTPNVPFGWSGFAALFEGVPAQAPACPAAFPSPNPYTGFHTPVAQGASCSQCGCGMPEGEVCDLPDTFKTQNAPCGGDPNYFGNGMFPVAWNGACNGQSYFPGGVTTCDGPCNVAITAPAPTVTGGMCPPTGGVATVPPLTWAIIGKACGDPAVGGGCGAGKACLPKPASPFVSGLCIYKLGDQECPATDFTDKHVFYGGADDTRGCADCSCGAPAGSTCSASIDFHSETQANTCTTKIATLVAGGCVDLVGNPVVGSKTATITQQPAGGSCTPGGGGPKGDVTPVDPTTFCCAP
jgi:hypothetical protein